MTLTPEERDTLTEFLEQARRIENCEHHFRRTDALFGFSVVLVTVLASVVASIEAGVVGALATGLLFPLGVVFGATLITARQRRRAYAQVSAVREIAELSLLYHEDER